jgi:flagellar basal body-associated protein FliL
MKSQGKNRYRFSRIIFCLLLCFQNGFAVELSEKEKQLIDEEAKIRQAKKEGTVRIYPDIVTNLRRYENNNENHYVLLRLDVIAIDSMDAEFIDMNQPIIKDALILFLNKQFPSNFDSAVKKESIHKRMIDTINKALSPEAKKEMIKDIIIQKMIIE